MMKIETLERLIIDRELEQLPGDAAELLEAYLAQSPGAAEAARELAETLLLARRALSEPPSPALPPPAFKKVMKFPGAAAPRRKGGAWIAAMAACLAAGMFAGSLMERTHRQASAGSGPVAAAVPEAGPAGPAGGAAPGFWSARRLHALAAANAGSAGPRIVWKSPVRRPSMEQDL